MPSNEFSITNIETFNEYRPNYCDVVTVVLQGKRWQVLVLANNRGFSHEGLVISPDWDDTQEVQPWSTSARHIAFESKDVRQYHGHVNAYGPKSLWEAFGDLASNYGRQHTLTNTEGFKAAYETAHVLADAIALYNDSQNPKWRVQRPWHHAGNTNDYFDDNE